MTFFKIFLVLFWLCSQAAFCNDNFYVLRSRQGAGFFSVFFDVLGALDNYEKGLCKGVDVNFGTGGLYYEKSKGANWWNYYFKPIQQGTIADAKIVENTSPGIICFAIYVELQMKRERAHELINRYITIHTPIRKYVDEFARHRFKQRHVIGIHYRGTDKRLEVPLVPYQTVFQEIDRNIQKNSLLFVATDDGVFLKKIKARYGKRVLYVKDSTRSIDEKPLHTNAKSPYKQGKEALIDCLLLARTNLIIRTSSNLSLAATFFNPDVNVIELSKRDPTVFSLL